MAIVTILALAALVLMIWKKAYLPVIVGILCGIFLMGTGTGLGQTIRDGVVSVSTAVDKLLSRK